MEILGEGTSNIFEICKQSTDPNYSKFKLSLKSVEIESIHKISVRTRTSFQISICINSLILKTSS